MRFIPNMVHAKETEESCRSRVKITISDSIQIHFPIFSNGGAEDVVNLIRTHKSIITDKKLEEHYEKLKKLLKKERETLKELKKQSGDIRQQQVEKEELLAETRQ